MAQRQPLLLLADAQRGHLRAQQHAAEEAGYRVLTAPTIRRALEILDLVRPSAVVAEAALADGRGIALMEATRRQRALRTLPVILVGPLTEQEQWQVLADPWAYAARDAEPSAIAARLYPAFSALGRALPTRLWFVQAILRQWWRQRRTRSPQTPLAELLPPVAVDMSERDSSDIRQQRHA